MSSNTPGRHPLTASIFKNPLSSISKTVMLLFFVLGFVHMASAQQPACNSVRTSKSVACPNELITLTANLNDASANLPVTWSITPVNSGAFFVSSGTSSASVTGVSGVNTIQVNAGPETGTFSIKLAYSGFPETGTCNASFVVKVNCGQ